MSKNPAIASELQRDPKLIDNQAWVRSHPALKSFLHNHPEARADFKHRPDHFVHKEDRYQNHHN
ncbi:MAG: hypothetical protein WA854_15735, partial [Candidatus Binataceae bacterium]